MPPSNDNNIFALQYTVLPHIGKESEVALCHLLQDLFREYLTQQSEEHTDHE